jgi:hypothetical protein
MKGNESSLPLSPSPPALPQQYHGVNNDNNLVGTHKINGKEPHSSTPPLPPPFRFWTVYSTNYLGNSRDEGKETELGKEALCSEVPSSLPFEFLLDNSDIPVCSYEATNTRLGSLEKFSTEIRLIIFEMALEIERPVKLRTCCKYDHNEETCNFHKEPLHGHASRFALYFTSSQIWSESSSLLTKKAVLLVEIPASAWYVANDFTDAGVASHFHKAFAAYRNIEIEVSKELTKQYGFRGIISATRFVRAIRVTLDRFVDHWKRLPSTTPDMRQRTVTVNFGYLLGRENDYPDNSLNRIIFEIRPGFEHKWNDAREAMLRIARDTGKTAL